ncbi:MAG: helix-turn-helix domain-containing protein [Novosphingobium sp.]
MVRRTTPAVDAAVSSRGGTTRQGQPLSYNRAPAADLAPWVARLYATVVDLPEGHTLHCGLLRDSSNFRIQLRGAWSAETADGLVTGDRTALFFGPQTKRMPVTVTGSFTSVGISLRPGTGHALRRAKTADYLDRVVPCEEMGLPGEAVLQMLERESEPEAWLQILEGVIRQIVQASGGEQPDPITQRFEALAFVDPTVSVADFASECGIDQRKLERIVRRDFGMAPKQMLRRARALDMASYLRGVGDPAEAEELLLRYYDQSHLIREFTELFGMSPRQFVATPQPILTLALESRQARRLEMMERLEPGGVRPWQ